MGDAFDSPGLQGFRKVVRTAGRIRGKATRDPAGGMLTPTGILDVNVAGTELFDRVAELQSLKTDEYGCVFGGDETRRQVAAVLRLPGEEDGVSAVRRSTDRKTITLYLSEVLADMPSLRPATTMWCRITKEPDGKDGFYLAIHLNTALEPGPVRHRVKPAPTTAE